MVYYIGILDGENDVWGIRIPDLPGCHGAGGTAEAALHDAISAAREWAEHHNGKGQAMPKARSLMEIAKQEGINSRAGELAVMIPVLIDSGRTVRANLSFDAGLLSDIDSEAARRGLTRSGFLASAAREKIISAGLEKQHR